MKALIERANLAAAAAHAHGVAERKNAIPILSNVLIGAKENQLRIVATDLDVEMVESVPAMVMEEGEETVSAQIFHEIVRKIPDGTEIALSRNAETGRMQLEAGASLFQLATLPRKDFPVMAQDDYAHRFTVPAECLRDLLGKSYFTISNEETRFYLNGVYLHVIEDGDGALRLRAVATDGHRLARIQAQAPEAARDAPGVIVPRKTVGELRRLLENESCEVTIGIAKTKIRFATDNFAFTSKVIDGTFPDYNRVIPTRNDKHLTFDVAALAAALDRVSTVSMERTRAVKFALSKDTLLLSVSSPDAGEAQETVPVQYACEDIRLGFSARYMSEVLHHVDSEKARLSLLDPLSPTILHAEGDDRALYIIMPLRV